jgi:hypothetical protein
MTNKSYFLIAIVALTACVSVMRPRMLTASELAQRGTRVYSTDATTAMRAATVALQSLGFEITISDSASGTIKTAPRDIMMAASGGALYRDELAWTLTISSHASGIQVVATPQVYTNGTKLELTQVPADAIEPKFTTLWNELDADMKQLAASSL